MQDNRSEVNILELIQKTRAHDKDAFGQILSVYSDMLHSIVISCMRSAGDYDDLLQEAKLGLYKAVMAYDSKYAAFSTFAYICVKSSVISCIRKANAKSNIPQNLVSSLSEDGFDILNAYATPESELIDKENVELLMKKIDSSLSPFERDVLSLYLCQEPYAQIAAKLNKSEKSIDNAVQRIRKKLKALL